MIQIGERAPEILGKDETVKQPGEGMFMD